MAGIGVIINRKAGRKAGRELAPWRLGRLLLRWTGRLVDRTIATEVVVVVAGLLAVAFWIGVAGQIARLLRASWVDVKYLVRYHRQRG